MSKQLAYSDLDLSCVPQVVVGDRLWQRCIHLALRSKGKDQRYGAVLVSKRGRVLGEGWNRSLLVGKRMEKFPLRTSFMLHSEVAAMGDALRKHGKGALSGATLYVAGFFVKEKRPLVRKGKATNTCVRCTKYYAQFGLLAAFMSVGGWVVYSGEIAYKNALVNAKFRKENKMSSLELRKKLFLQYSAASK